MTLYVTRPSLPPLEDYVELLRSVWDTGILTNDGPLLQRFERELAEYLGVPGVVVFCNGTIALMAALSVSGVRGGEVITTPFTFPATVKAIEMAGAKPVFADIDPDTWTLDADLAQRVVTTSTRAILPVNVFGAPCRGVVPSKLPVVFDAAHAFGRLNWHDMSALSFHATKLFTTGEGGAVVCRDSISDAHKLRMFRNFAIYGETGFGNNLALNGKMSELHAALGILNLRTVGDEIANRRRLLDQYKASFSDVSGIRFQKIPPWATTNGAYCAILINPSEFGLSRDGVCHALAKEDIKARRYFEPLASQGYRPASDFPVADYVSRNILCLPLYGSLPESEVERVCSIVKSKARS